MRSKEFRFRFSIPFYEIWLTILALSTFFVAINLKNLVSQAVLASVSASFFFVLSMRLTDFLKLVLDRRALRKVFGTAISSDDFYLVYPDFELTEDVQSAIRDLKIDADRIYTKPSGKYRERSLAHIPQCVAINDMHAMMILGHRIGEKMNKTYKIRVDRDAINNAAESFISFGLASNDCTHQYQELLGEKVPFKMQKVDQDAYGLVVTIPVQKEGEEKFLEFRSNPQREIGILVGYSPNVEHTPGVRWSICGGIGPDATVGVAHWVAHNWLKLSRIVGKCDYLCVFSVPQHAHDLTRLLLVIIDGKPVFEGDAID